MLENRFPPFYGKRNKGHRCSRTPLSQTQLIGSPRYFERRSNSLGFTLMFSVITIRFFELGYFEFPALSNSSFFPYTLNQPRYFELVKNRVQEETPKRPTKSEVRQQSRLSHATVCLELRFEGKQAFCHSRSTKVVEKIKTTEHSKIFQCNSIC